MHIFRRNLDPSLASPRVATEADLTAVSWLLRGSTRRFIAFSNGELPALLAGAPSMLLVADGELWAAAIGGWPCESVIWLRALALSNNLPVEGGLDHLLPPFLALLRSRKVRSLFYASGDSSDVWLRPALSARGYVCDTEVVVYEKRGLEIPSPGNPAVRVRRAEAVDLPAVLAIDHACFSPQWYKDEGIIGSSLVESPYFVIAELDGAPVAFAFATTHYSGRLIHLVRIAVLPAYQGCAVGVRLLAEVVGYARALSADALTLNTQIDNARARRLYEWFGFRRTGEAQTVLRYDLSTYRNG